VLLLSLSFSLPFHFPNRIRFRSCFFCIRLAAHSCPTNCLFVILFWRASLHVTLADCISGELNVFLYEFSVLPSWSLIPLNLSDLPRSSSACLRGGGSSGIEIFGGEWDGTCHPLLSFSSWRWKTIFFFFLSLLPPFSIHVIHPFLPSFIRSISQTVLWKGKEKCSVSAFVRKFSSSSVGCTSWWSGRKAVGVVRRGCHQMEEMKWFRPAWKLKESRKGSRWKGLPVKKKNKQHAKNEEKKGFFHRRARLYEPTEVYASLPYHKLKHPLCLPCEQKNERVKVKHSHISRQSSLLSLAILFGMCEDPLTVRQAVLPTQLREKQTYRRETEIKKGKTSLHPMHRSRTRTHISTERHKSPTLAGCWGGQKTCHRSDRQREMRVGVRREVPRLSCQIPTMHRSLRLVVIRKNTLQSHQIKVIRRIRTLSVCMSDLDRHCTLHVVGFPGPSRDRSRFNQLSFSSAAVLYACMHGQNCEPECMLKKNQVSSSVCMHACVNPVDRSMEIYLYI